jgi:glycosyltransferase involved in cell wall biosynthesis
MKDRVLAKGMPAERVHLIPVWSDLGEAEPLAHEQNPFRERWGLGGAFCVMYSGNFGIGHEAMTICNAMERLRDRADIKFLFVGGGKRRREVEAFIKDKGLTSASYHDYVPREVVGQSLSAADVHLISLREGCEGIICPSKLFGVMAVARPSVYVGNPSSEIARVLVESGSGILTREGQDREMAEAIAGLADDRERARRMGAQARRELMGKYDKVTLCGRWVELLESMQS